MNLFYIAKKNILKNIKSYGLYLFSLIFTVSVYECFKTLEYSSAVTDNIALLSHLSTIFNSASVVIAVFSFVFVLYSSNFFIRKRKKEIGLYALLGIENKSIALLLFFETLFLGVIALIIGTFVGVFFSSIAFGLLSKITIDTFVFELLFSPKAILVTAITFLIIYIIISIQSSSIIYKHTLIELFKANSQSETKPTGSVFKAILSVALIAFGYGIYFALIKSNIGIAFVTLVLVVIGTYLFFSSMLFFYINMKRKNKKHLYNGMNIISTNQLLYRIKGNSRTLATITILTATTLTAMATVVCIQKDFKVTVHRDNPFSYVTSYNDADYISKIESTISKYPSNSLLYNLKVDTLDVVGSTKPMDKNFNQKRGNEYTVISESEFRKILNYKPYVYEFEELKNETDAINLNAFSINKDPVYLPTKDGQVKLNVVDEKKMSLINNSLTMSSIVVKDSLYEKLSATNNTSYNLYQVDDRTHSSDLTNELTALSESYGKELNKTLNGGLLVSFYDTYFSMSIDTGTLMFIGMFLGLIFLVCTGSIIFFNQVSEAEEETQRYKILRNIGVNNKELKKSIYKQVAFIFAAPLVLATIHSTVAITFVAGILNQKTSSIMVFTLVPYLIVYIVYYILTSFYYFKTIEN